MRNMFLELRSCVLKYEFEGGEIVDQSSQSPRPYLSCLLALARLFTHFHCTQFELCGLSNAQAHGSE